MIFQEKPTATISAKVTGSSKMLSLDGITTGSTTPENAAAQINKILNVVGSAVTTSGMVRTRKEEAIDNG